MSTQRHFKPWAFILPGLFAGGVILGVPIVQAFWNSLHQLRLYRMDQQTFIGFENYLRLWQDPIFLLSARVTFVFTVGCTVLSVVAALTIAAIMSTRGIRGTWAARFFMAGFLIPFVATQVIVGVIGRLFVWEPEYGFVNFLLEQIGIVGPGWLISTDTALIATIITNAWRLTPLALLIFYAALATVPDELLESAEVDGASGIVAFLRVKLPVIQYHIGFVTLILITSAFREFDMIYSLTGGGPGRATNVLSLHVYNQGIASANMGVANAIAFSMLVMVAVLSVIYIKLARLGDLSGPG